MADILRECPFCGGRPAIEDVTWEFELIGANKPKKSWWVVECWDCHARTQPMSIQHKAVELWNRRKAREQRSEEAYVVDIRDLKKAIVDNPYDPSKEIAGYLRYLRYNTPRYGEGDKADE